MQPNNPYATPQQPKNYLPVEIDYRIQETGFGTWRSFLYEDKTTFQEFTSHATIAGLPLVHYVAGKSPETGRSKLARGVIAIGRFAIGGFACGQVACGIITVGQASFGLGLGIGQLAIGGVAIGQAAISAYFALGQFAFGYHAIGQFAAGVNVTGQMVYRLLN